MAKPGSRAVYWLLGALSIASCGTESAAESPEGTRSVEFEERRVETPNGEATIVADLLEPEAPIGTVVLIPSLARGPADFTEEYGSDLATQLAAQGYQVIMIWPRGFLSMDDDAPPSIELLASDVAAVLDSQGSVIPAVIIGHAFGQRVARMLATTHPELVESLVLIAAGGRVPIPTEISSDLILLALGAGDQEERLAALERVFFAPGNDATVWLDGWNVEAGLRQSASNGASPSDVYWAGGGVVDMCVLQAADDVIAPAEDSSQLLLEEFPDRVEVITITDAGHAMLPEQPEQVAAAVLGCL